MTSKKCLCHSRKLAIMVVLTILAVAAVVHGVASNDLKASLLPTGYTDGYELEVEPAGMQTGAVMNMWIEHSASGDVAHFNYPLEHSAEDGSTDYDCSGFRLKVDGATVSPTFVESSVDFDCNYEYRFDKSIYFGNSEGPVTQTGGGTALSLGRGEGSSTSLDFQAGTTIVQIGSPVDAMAGLEDSDSASDDYDSSTTDADGTTGDYDDDYQDDHYYDDDYDTDYDSTYDGSYDDDYDSAYDDDYDQYDYDDTDYFPAADDQDYHYDECYKSDEDVKRELRDLRENFGHMERWLKDTKRDFADAGDFASEAGANLGLLDELAAVLNEFEADLAGFSTSSEVECDAFTDLWDRQADFWDLQQEFDESRELVHVYVNDIKQITREISFLKRQISQDLRRSDRDSFFGGGDKSDFKAKLKAHLKEVEKAEKDFLAYVMDKENIGKDEIRGSDVWFVFEEYLRFPLDEIFHASHEADHLQFVEDHFAHYKEMLEHSEFPDDLYAQLKKQLEKAERALEAGDVDEAIHKLDAGFEMTHGYFDEKHFEDRFRDTFTGYFEDDAWDQFGDHFDRLPNRAAVVGALVENGNQFLVDDVFEDLPPHLVDNMVGHLSELARINSEFVEVFSQMMSSAQEIYEYELDRALKSEYDLIVGKLADGVYSEKTRKKIAVHHADLAEKLEGADEEEAEKIIEEMAALLDPAVEQENLLEEGTISFRDNDTTQWYWTFIENAAKYDYLSGDDSGKTVRPADPALYGEGLKMILAMADKKIHEPTGALPYADVQRGAWYEKFYYSFEKEVGPISNYLDATNPGNRLSRAEFARLYCAALGDNLVAGDESALKEYADFGSIQDRDYRCLASLKTAGLMTGKEEVDTAGNVTRVVFDPNGQITRAGIAKLLVEGKERIVD